MQSQTTDAIINAVKQNFTLLKDKDTGVSTDGDIRLTLEKFSQTKLNVPTSKIFDILLLKIAAQNVDFQERICYNKLNWGKKTQISEIHS